jgi:hypothetical protein
MLRFGCGAHVMGQGHHYQGHFCSQKCRGKFEPTPASHVKATETFSDKRSNIMGMANLETARQADALSPATGARMIPVLGLGMALSLFLVISYLLCVISYLALPGLPINHDMLSLFLPGFELLSWQSFFLGLVESFTWP